MDTVNFVEGLNVINNPGPKPNGDNKLSSYPRRKSKRVMVGGIPVGGGAPISVQTMTKLNLQTLMVLLLKLKDAKKQESI